MARLLPHCKCSLEFVANKVKWQTGLPATKFHTHTHTHARRRKQEEKNGVWKSVRKASKAGQENNNNWERAEKIGNLTFDVFYETCSNNILGNLF